MQAGDIVTTDRRWEHTCAVLTIIIIIIIYLFICLFILLTALIINSGDNNIGEVD